MSTIINGDPKKERDSKEETKKSILEYCNKQIDIIKRMPIVSIELYTNEEKLIMAFYNKASIDQMNIKEIIINYYLERIKQIEKHSLE